MLKTRHTFTFHNAGLLDHCVYPSAHCGRLKRDLITSFPPPFCGMFPYWVSGLGLDEDGRGGAGRGGAVSVLSTSFCTLRIDRNIWSLSSHTGWGYSTWECVRVSSCTWVGVCDVYVMFKSMFHSSIMTCLQRIGLMGCQQKPMWKKKYALYFSAGLNIDWEWKISRETPRFTALATLEQINIV